MANVTRTKKQTYAALLASSIYRAINELSADEAWSVVSKWSNAKIEQYLVDHPRKENKTYHDHKE